MKKGKGNNYDDDDDEVNNYYEDNDNEDEEEEDTTNNIGKMNNAKLVKDEHYDMAYDINESGIEDY